MKKKNKYIELIKCPKCEYCNQIENAKKYGTCTRCGAVIDPKAKFEYEMVTKLRLWRKKWEKEF